MFFLIAFVVVWIFFGLKAPSRRPLLWASWPSLWVSVPRRALS